MKRKIAMLFVGAGLLLALSVMGVAAAPNTVTAIPNDIPATAVYVDGTSQTIAGNSALWYKFDYMTGVAPEERTLSSLTLVNGTDKGVTFDVYSADQIATWWENNPVGRGTSQGSMGAQSMDLTWDGKFQANGVQYVQVTNTNPDATTFTLMVK